MIDKCLFRTLFVLLTCFSTSFLIGQTQLGQSIYGEAKGDESGIISFSHDGNIIAIGAPGNKGKDSLSGHVRVFEWDGTEWAQLGQDIDGEGIDTRFGQSVSLTSHGKILAIGAWAANGINGTGVGQVRVYNWDGLEWVQIGQTLEGTVEYDGFGEYVSLSADGNVLAVGAPKSNWWPKTGERGLGKVWVYVMDGGEWVQRGNYLEGDSEMDGIGWSVKLSADGTVLAFAMVCHSIRGQTCQKGYVRFYKWDGFEWVQLGEDITAERSVDWAGRSISISSDGYIVAIGADDNSDNGTHSGHVRVFQWDGAKWTQLGEDIDGDASYNGLGYSVSLSSDGLILAAGAMGNETNGDASGQVKVFDWNGSSWNLKYAINGENPNDQAGRFVCLSGNGERVAISDLGRERGTPTGNVRIFGILPTMVNHPSNDLDVLAVYPNPGNNHINIEAKTGIESVWIFQFDGHIVNHKKFSGEFNTSQVVNISNLNAGIYWVKVDTRTGTVFSKFTKL